MKRKCLLKRGVDLFMVHVEKQLRLPATPQGRNVDSFVVFRVL